MARRTTRTTLLLTVGLATSALVAGGALAPAVAAPPPPGPLPGPAHHSRQPQRKGDLDVRSAPVRPTTGTQRRSTPDLAARERAWRHRLGDQAVVQLDPLTGTPRTLGRLDGFLTGRSKSKARTVVLRYLRKHAAELGLTQADIDTFVLRRDYRDVAGIHHLSWAQTVDGLPVFGNGLKANVTRRGQIISLEGAPVADLANRAAGAARTAGISAADSRRRAAEDVGGRAADVRLTRRGDESRWANRDSARLSWFLTPTGLRRAWSTYVQAGRASSYQHVIDATSGAVLYRHDLVDFENGDALVYENYPGAPKGGTQHVRNLVRAGYLPKTATTLSGGTYVSAWSDVDDDDQIGPGEQVLVPGHDRSAAQYRLRPYPAADPSCATAYVCTWDPARGGSWRLNRAADVTQGFYLTSRFHGYLKGKPFGFTRAAGNFEARDGDPLLLNDLDGASTAPGDLPDGDHVDNANMSTPPDGTPPTMQMYLFHAPGASDDDDPFLPTSSSFDASVILHEYTHGLSNRLVVDANGDSTLNSLQAGSMGEAWSDYYAEDYLVHRGLERDTKTPGQVLSGRYVSKGVPIARTMAIDCPVGAVADTCTRLDGTHGGYTYGELSDVIGFPEVHASGEIWSQTLWDVRHKLGHTVAGTLVTRAMELSPTDPSFLDMRNAILQADLAIYGGKHQKKLWRLFAHRGMGFFAATVGAGDPTPVEDFSTPPGRKTARATITGTVTDGDTRQPVAGVEVGVSGHDSGFGGDYAAVTGPDGRYTIRNVVVGTYPVLLPRTAGGYLPVSKRVVVGRGENRVDFTVRRDWAASSGGAGITDVTGPDLTDFGCGPDAAIDLDLGTGWVSTTGDDEGTPTNRPVPKSLTVQLPEPVDVTSVAIDPSATCGLDATSSTAGYRVEVSADGSAWSTVSTGTFGAADRGRLNDRPVQTGAPVGFVRFTMLSPQVPDLAQTCPDSDDAGCSYMGMTELVVYGRSAQPADAARTNLTVPTGRR